MAKLQADLSRNTIVVVAAAAVVLAAIGYAGYALWESHTTPPSHVAEVRGSSRPAQGTETEHYSKVLQHYNETHAAQAAATPNDSYISVMSTRTRDVPPPPDMPASATATSAPTPAAPAASAPQPTATSYQGASNTAAVYRSAPVDPEHAKNLADQVTGMLANWTGQPHGLAKVSDDDKGYAQSLMPAVLTQATRTGVGAQGEQKGVQLISGLTDAAALLRTNIDTDESSETEAFIPAGPYAGALLSAPGYKILGNSVDLTFTSMQWNGRTYKVNAKAVDEHTLRTSLSGEVNNRYVSRILLPALAAGIARAGQLYQQAGTTTIITPQGGAIQSSPSSPSLKDVGGTIIGGGGQAAATVLTQDAANMPSRQVLVAAGTTIGIRFLAPVFSGDEMTGGAMQAQAQGQGQIAYEPPQPRRQAPGAFSTAGTNAPFDGASGQQPGQSLTVQSPFAATVPAPARNP